jgi:hypothetical protein
VRFAEAEADASIVRDGLLGCGQGLGAHLCEAVCRCLRHARWIRWWLCYQTTAIS